MMVSFLKSSHGLASQRCPGRESLIHSESKIRKHDTVWKHILAFLFMMLSVGSASRARRATEFVFRENELPDSKFYEQFTLADHRKYRNQPTKVPRRLRDIVTTKMKGLWRSESQSETEISVSETGIKSTFAQMLWTGNGQQELKIRFSDRITEPRYVDFLGKQRLVLIVEQANALWIITPMLDSKGNVYIRWHTNKVLKKGKRTDFDYRTMLSSRLSPTASEYQRSFGHEAKAFVPQTHKSAQTPQPVRQKNTDRLSESKPLSHSAKEFVSARKVEYKLELKRPNNMPIRIGLHRDFKSAMKPFIGICNKMDPTISNNGSETDGKLHDGANDSDSETSQAKSERKR